MLKQNDILSTAHDAAGPLCTAMSRLRTTKLSVSQTGISDMHTLLHRGSYIVSENDHKSGNEWRIGIQLERSSCRMY